ncbi:hypothetical protein HX049_17595 [Myroides odoratimimus]|uniref:hypothetical protein n=1 Tax=Myroides odoratimimus TaxID=76832 RepID=UPI00257640EB|nr:hypothetical protein [Myroides odoratimimus]MDM1398953.1 hypothetical protein [Myroides odoratimimus]
MNIPIYKAYEVKEANPLSPLKSPITLVIGLFLCAGVPHPFKNTHKELFHL